MALLSIRVLCAGICLLFPSLAFAQQYTVTDLGVLPGGGAAYGLAISPSGEFVAGLSYLTFSPSPFTAVLWTGGVLSDIGGFGGDYSEAFGVNDAGDAVGMSSYDPGQNSDRHAFLYRGGEMLDLGPGSAAAINRSGLVVGDLFFGPSAGDHHAFLYDGQSVTDLGRLGGTGPSEATAINDAGVIVGSSDTSSGFQHAFRYESGTGMVDLGTLARRSGATAVNGIGQAAGWSVNDSGFTMAVIFTGDQVIELGTLGGCARFTPFCSLATGINSSGDVIGRAHLPSGAETPFLYHDGGMMNLNDIITPGWALWFVFAINDAGQIVGAAAPAGEPSLHAVLLTPAVP